MSSDREDREGAALAAGGMKGASSGEGAHSDTAPLGCVVAPAGPPFGRRLALFVLALGPIPEELVPLIQHAHLRSGAGSVSDQHQQGGTVGEAQSVPAGGPETKKPPGCLVPGAGGTAVETVGGSLVAHQPLEGTMEAHQTESPCREPEPDEWASGSGAQGYCRCGHMLHHHDPSSLTHALQAMAGEVRVTPASVRRVREAVKRQQWGTPGNPSNDVPF